MSIKAYKGNIIFTKALSEFTILEGGYIIVENDKVKGTFKSLPDDYKSVEVTDYGDKLIIPGFVDTHLHAPQFPNRGLGLDKELLPWLETYTFPEESKFSDVDYAKRVYSRLVHELWRVGTTRSVVFGTIHKDSTKALMDLFIEAGLGAFVGKVNMDRNSPDYLIEDTEQSLKDTEEILKEYSDKCPIVKPIITPRFVPTCTPELMKGLGELAKKYNAPIQSHLSENRGEVEWVKELHPDQPNYSKVYDAYGLFGDQPTVMAHCVHNNDDEIKLMAKNGVYVAHSPDSNYNLSSGIAPIRKYLDNGVNVGLASDISGGHTISIPECITTAVQGSKARWVYLEEGYNSLSTSEAFYIATKGGGSFLGKVGSFEEGYEFDALIIDDSSLADVNERSLSERIERFLYIGDDRNIVDRYVAGIKIKEPRIIK
ncbi:guanine deaminase GuaD [Gottschalkia acidurici 9a]|uniref:Guanine deaminase n=1 Tax=Gottschalkia acidurici (strain ATCC 7906 / DSM 604 / BCRC 14475 / CIP 104303 / KCTC 5404 / NCIMB 10678 / 9a) TaxID=1128398 RepID=K0AV18_GOTA9|nr:guanine deaminase [Gottschalkia acidurici]AFS77109.1 guanine deaminase GuaD [Gottschalkia acidurici 9a]